MPQLPGRLSAAKSLLAATLLASLGAGCAQGTADAPRLVVLIVVDQLRPERLHPGLPGGLGRLLRKGRSFPDTVHDHAHTETCSGHVALAFGRHPGPAGVPGNWFVDPETARIRVCVEDPAEDARTLGGSTGRSPRQIRTTALGDWLKAARPEARVFAVSPKDRAAIPLGGKKPDAVYWLDTRGARGFTTSRYYRADLPEWVRRFNGGEGDEGFLAGLPPQWEHATGNPPNGARADAFEGESEHLSATSPHPVADSDRATALGRLQASPFGDAVTLDFARALITHEGLGRGPAPDLLALSLSATDVVGHLYGPHSQEARDALQHLDRDLGRFLDFLEGRVGRRSLLIALTSDHGVLDLPEWLVATGRGSCPLPGSRGNTALMHRALEIELSAQLGDEPGDGQRWVLAAEHRLTVNRSLARARGLSVEEIAARALQFLDGQPGVARVWTAEEIARGGGPQPFAALYRNSHTPERGGDLVVQPAPDCLLNRFPVGTSHGGPYLYDRAVPLVFFGAGVQPGEVRGVGHSVDVAPTLAAALGIPVPDDLDGVVLPLAP